ncbi:MAG: 3-deoxy-7-phosphoheptulonate synthase, partial [Lachnospiraceae bacterium]|nr:3-deoxy-7-phosphoheptulonate synthase [Lachnospiraceae bacterium]
MIVILKQNATAESIKELKENLIKKGFDIHESHGTSTTILGLVGDTSTMTEDHLLSYEAVEMVRRIREPFKLANRRVHPKDTIIDVAGTKIGSGHFQVIAGPCSIETKDQIIEVAKAVKMSGAKFLRGGAFKPRTSPYSFQGLHEDGLDLLLEAKKSTG